MKTLPTNELAKLRDLLREWPGDRVLASEKGVRSLLEKLLRVCGIL